MICQIACATKSDSRCAVRGADVRDAEPRVPV